MNLKRQLMKIKEASSKEISQDIIDILKEAVEKNALNEIENKALKVGDKFPDFALKNAVGERIDSSDLLEDGPLVINFYRGGWCPYCNVELLAYQDILNDIHALGGQLVAISPELPDNSLTLIGKHSLEYEILSDIGNEISREVGLVFTVEEELHPVYKKLGVDLVATQGNENYELPVPATYVVGTNGTIILSYVDTDYTNRLEPVEVLTVL